MKAKLRIKSIALCILFGFWGITFVQRAEAKESVIALIQEDEGLEDLLALLEVHLSKGHRYKLVEREHLEDVLREQSLAALSEASAGGQRVELGRLIGADLLVILRNRTSPAPHCEVFVSEVSRGIRLRVSQVSLREGAEKASRAIQQEIEIALKKQAEPLRAIVAVPPFVNRDLTATYQHLQGAYARLLESMLSRMSGIVLVEMAEARALAQEAALSGASVKRSYPLYFSGEYRFETVNPLKPPFVSLALQRGDEIFGYRKAKAATPQDAAGFLRRAVFELLDEHSLEPSSTIEGNEEYHSLSQRAQLHFSIGAYQEAAQLAEASLLLSPQQAELHFLAMSAYGRCARQVPDNVPETLHLIDLAAYHLEQFLRQGHFEDFDSPVFNSISEAFYPMMKLANQVDDETKQEIYALRQRVRTVFFSAIQAKFLGGELTDTLLRLVLSRGLWNYTFMGESFRENLQERLELVPALLAPSLKHPKNFLKLLLHQGIRDEAKLNQDYEWFLNELSAYDHPDVQSLVKSEQRLLERLSAPKPRPVHKEPSRKSDTVEDPTSSEIPDFTLKPIQLRRADKKPGDRSFEMWGLLKCGEATDLVWGSSETKEVFLMKEKGLLQKIFEAGKRHSFGQASFDGRYAWLPVAGPEARVLRIDPESGSVLEFTQKDGLPAFRAAASASIGEGRLCLSAAFGSVRVGRAFIALLEVSENGRKQVRVVHEASHQLMPDQTPDSYNQNPESAYIPKFMFSNQTNGKWSVMIGRSMPTGVGFYPFLQFHLDSMSAEVVDADLKSYFTAHNVVITEEGVYWSDRRNGLRFLHIGADEDEWVRSLPEEGVFIIYDGRLHLMGTKWWVADGLHKPFRKLEGNVHAPGFYHSFFVYTQYFVSAHYGLIFKIKRGPSTQVIFHENL